MDKYEAIAITQEEKARLMKNKYQREWAKKNPDKVKASMQRYYAKKYDEFMAEFERGDLDE